MTEPTLIYPNLYNENGEVILTSESTRFTVGTVTALSPDADPTVTITGTPPDLMIDFGIPASALIADTAAVVDAVEAGIGADAGAQAAIAAVLPFTQSGASAVARPLIAKAREFVTPDDFYNSSDTDDTLSWQRAVAAHPCVRGVPGKTYVISQQVQITRDNSSIDLRGCVIDATAFRDGLPAESNRPDGVFHVQGAAKLTTTLAASPAEAAVSVELTSATGVAAGDVIFLFASSGSTQIWYHEGLEGVDVRRSFITKVTGVSGTTVSLQDALPFDFDISLGSVNVTVWRGVVNVDFYGGLIRGPGFVTSRVNGVGEAGISTEYAQNVHIHGTCVEDMQGAVAWFSRTYGFSQRGGKSIGRPRSYTPTGVGDEFFTGTWAYESAVGLFDNLNGERHRHLVDGARSRDVVVSNCGASECHASMYTTHTGCDDWTWINNKGAGDTAGILWRGHNWKVIGGYMDIPTATAPCYYDTVGVATGLARTTVLIGAKGRAAREVVAINGNTKYALLDACDGIGAISAGYAPVSIATLDLEHFEVRGGRFENKTGGSVILGANNTPRTRKSVKVDGATLVGYGSGNRAVRVFSGASATVDLLSVKECTLVPGPGFTGDHVVGTGTFSKIETGPNYVAGAVSWPRDIWLSGTHYTVGDGTTNATLSATDTISVRDFGSFILIGGRIRTTGLAGVTGNMRLNLPVTLAQPCGGYVTHAAGLALGTAGHDVNLRGSIGQNYLTFTFWSTTAGTGNLTAASFTTSADITFVATLIV